MCNTNIYFIAKPAAYTAGFNYAVRL